MTPIHPLYAAMAPTIFEHMSGLARAHDAINLGQGFPDGRPHPDMVDAAARALAEKSHQYPPAPGLPELRDAIAAFYARRQGLALTREQVVVTSGATEALAAAILALVHPGDEVLLFQPAYDSYAPMIRRAGGVPVSVPLSPPGWRYDAGRIAAAITPRTRLAMLNDPLNPAGTVASEAELAMIADLCRRHDLTAICDEVWEDVRFDGVPHRSLLAMPGMERRAVKIGSAGKIFGLTGWKVGWLAAAPDLAQALGRAHQFLTFTTPPALQWAVAEGLAKPDAWFAEQRAGWAAARRHLSQSLERAGFVVLPNAATWFLCIDLAASGIMLADRDFAERAVREAGVASIPVSALFEGDAPRHILRLCFAKDHATLDEAVARLAAFRAALL
ncbi:MULTISPECIES: aminotransferase [unclassified Sphingopyxis]|uniref:aminotransferase n=1 Tax=unclassified Sphingopyxis TaxID=2614943 RepID=UPI0007366634|nr:MULTISPECIES: aminotransferase [unclassified Sphingopyxis]KTE36569.1 aminotransferase [Sphingopyxis sp. HIX]KTE84475.1 aminotransferase [Sphingopyxis sp. HXXIV]